MDSPTSAPTELRVFVNGRGQTVPLGATALEAVRAADAAEADAIAAGTRMITDSRGLPLALESPAHGGAIYRTVRAKPASTEG